MADEKEIEYDLARKFRRERAAETARAAVSTIFGDGNFTNKIGGDSASAAGAAISLGGLERAREDARRAVILAQQTTDPELKKQAMIEIGKMMAEIGSTLRSHSDNTATGSAAKLRARADQLIAVGDKVAGYGGKSTPGELKTKAESDVSEIRLIRNTGPTGTDAANTGTDRGIILKRLREMEGQDRSAYVEALLAAEPTLAGLLQSGQAGSPYDDTEISEINTLLAQGHETATQKMATQNAVVDALGGFLAEGARLSAGGDSIAGMLAAFETAGAPFLDILQGFLEDGEVSAEDVEKMKALAPQGGIDPDEQKALDMSRLERDQAGLRRSDVYRAALEERQGYSTALNEAMDASAAPLNQDKFFRTYVRSAVRDRIAPGQATLPGGAPSPTPAPAPPPVAAPAPTTHDKPAPTTPADPPPTTPDKPAEDDTTKKKLDE